MRLLGGEVAFKVLDGFEVVLRDELILAAYLWLGELYYHISCKVCKLFGIKLKCLRCCGCGERFLAYSCSI